MLNYSIIGIGTDLVKIKRIERLLKRYNMHFVKKLLHPSELVRYLELPLHHQTSYIAKRFAAKEAVAKALGTGISKGLEFKDIAVLNRPSGEPYIEIRSDKYPEFALNKIHISLSDEKLYALAFAIASRP